MPHLYLSIHLRAAKTNLFADTPGSTVLTYTPNGRYIVTGGSNSAIRIYTVGQDGEPKTIDEGNDGHLGIGATVCDAIVLAMNLFEANALVE